MKPKSRIAHALVTDSGRLTGHSYPTAAAAMKEAKRRAKSQRTQRVRLVPL